MKRLTLITALVAVLPSLIGVTSTSPAAAETDEKALKAAKAKSPAKNDIDFVEFKINSIAKKMAKAGWSEAQSNLVTLYNDHVELEKRIAQLKQKDPAWDTKSYEASFKKSAAVLEKAIQAMQAEQDAVNRRLAQLSLFSSMADDYASSIGRAIDVLNEEVPGELSSIKSMVDAIGRLAEVDKQCTQNAFLEVQANFADKPPARQPEVVCTIAAQRKEVLKQLVPLAAKANLELLLANDKRAIDELKEGGWLSAYVLERLGNVSAYSKKAHDEFAAATAKAGAKVDASYFKPLEKNGPVFASALAEAAKKDRFPSTMTLSDGTLQAKAQSAGTALGGKLVRFRMTPGQWSVAKNDIGIPLYKWNVGAVNLKVGSESYCRVYPDVQFTGTYTGGGTYAAPEYYSGISSSASYKVSVCK